MSKEEIVRNVLYDAKLNGGNLDALFVKYNIQDANLQDEIRKQYANRIRDENVRAATERERNRAACGYASDPNDQAIIQEANKEVANMINEGTQDLAGGK